MNDANPETADPKLSAVVTVHNEERQLAECLSRLAFADELIVLLDKCTDGSKEIAKAHGARLIEGAWDLEGPRRNTALAEATGDWVLEVDADERVTDELAREVRKVIAASPYDVHKIPVDNYIGDRLVRYGWGGSYGKSSYPGLFRRGVKCWGAQRVHPALAWTRSPHAATGGFGPQLQSRLVHLVDRDISDMVKRLDSYASARAKDLRDSGKIGGMASNVRRLFSRFFKCYVLRKGYREGGYGFLIALFAGLYPLLSHLKASLERD